MGLKAQATVVLYVNGMPVAAQGTFNGMRAFPDTAAFQWAAVFMGVFGWVISPWAHLVACPAKRMAFLAASDAIWGIFRGFHPAVNVD